MLRGFHRLSRDADVVDVHHDHPASVRAYPVVFMADQKMAPTMLKLNAHSKYGCSICNMKSRRSLVHIRVLTVEVRYCNFGSSRPFPVPLPRRVLTRDPPPDPFPFDPSTVPFPVHAFTIMEGTWVIQRGLYFSSDIIGSYP